MELFSYILLTLAAVALSVRGTSLNTLTVVLCVSAFAALSIVVRASGYDSDIPVYVERMQTVEHGWYYFREPVVWYVQRLLFYVTKSDFSALVISDLLVYLMVATALYGLGGPAYALLSIVIFVPFVLGMQNVYRQWVASAFLLLAISRSKKTTSQAIVFYVLAVLSHSAAVFFLPLVTASTRWRLIGLIVSMLVLPVALFFGRGTRLESYTGADLGVVYFLVFVSLTALWCLLNKKRDRLWSDSAFISLFYLTYAVGVGVLLLPSSGAERLGLFGMLAAYPIFLKIVEEKMPHWFIRSGFIVGGFVPVLVFETRQFLV